MALHKRLCTSREWLEALTAHSLAGIKPHLRQNEDCWGMGRRVRILDATDIQEPGDTGSGWRIHYGLRLPEMCCDFFELTDRHGGQPVRARLCALRKSPEQSRRAWLLAQRKSRRK